MNKLKLVVTREPAPSMQMLIRNTSNKPQLFYLRCISLLVKEDGNKVKEILVNCLVLQNPGI